MVLSVEKLKLCGYCSRTFPFLVKCEFCGWWLCADCVSVAVHWCNRRLGGRRGRSKPRRRSR